MGADGWQNDGNCSAGAALRHARVEERLAAFADSELAPEQKRAVEEHLRRCRRCRRELALQQDLARALSQERIPAASADLRRKVEWMLRR